MTHRKIVILSFTVALSIGLLAHFYFLSLPAKGDVISKTYWKGTVDERLKQSEKSDTMIMAKLDAIDARIRSICDDVNAVKLEALRNSGLYGGGSGAVVFLIGSGIQALIRKRNGGKNREKNNG